MLLPCVESGTVAPGAASWNPEGDKYFAFGYLKLTLLDWIIFVIRVVYQWARKKQRIST